jgi:hypothetical protein
LEVISSSRLPSGSRKKTLFGRLKNWRRLATRYDRLARNHAALALVAVAAGPEWVPYLDQKVMRVLGMLGIADGPG